MEPPDVVITENFPISFVLFIEYNSIVYAVTVTASFGTLRLRGSGENPNDDKKTFDIPYLTNAKFKWDGLPCIDFREKVLNILENGLGSMLTNGGEEYEIPQRRFSQAAWHC